MKYNDISYIDPCIREGALNKETIALLDPSDSTMHQKCILPRNTASDAEYMSSLYLPKKMLAVIVKLKLNDQFLTIRTVTGLEIDDMHAPWNDARWEAEATLNFFPA